jgi:hypothetical protein
MEATDMSTDQPQTTAWQAGRDEQDRDHKWPWPARLAMTLLLVPVWCGALVSCEGDLDGYGLWLSILSVSLAVVIVTVVWATTGRSQR